MAGKTGILVVGHGTSSALGSAEFARVVSRIRDHFLDVPLAFAFLELSRPTIEDGLQVLLQKGVTSILTAPLLLFAAGHAKQDIPLVVQNVAAKCGIEVIGQAGVLGSHPQIIGLSLRRYREASETLSPDSAFVLVGRGNCDLEAQAAAAEFASRCQIQGKLSIARLGYLAMANPPVIEVLQNLGRSKIEQCVIVPHLLFHGELIAKCKKIVASIADQFPQTNWVLGSRLGPDEPIVVAAVDRIREAGGATFCGNGSRTWERSRP